MRMAYDRKRGGKRVAHTGVCIGISRQETRTRHRAKRAFISCALLLRKVWKRRCNKISDVSVGKGVDTLCVSRRHCLRCHPALRTHQGVPKTQPCMRVAVVSTFPSLSDQGYTLVTRRCLDLVSAHARVVVGFWPPLTSS